MFPSLYYACKELFGIEIPLLKMINTAGFFVALAFLPAAWLWKIQMKRREAGGALKPRVAEVVAGKKTYFINEWPHQTITGVIIIAAVSGVIGSKISGILESPALLLHAPLQALFSSTGFSFYGGLILASIIIWFYYQRRHINPLIVADCMSPAFMVAYAVGRLGCQFSGDGDWGIPNLHAKPLAWLPDWLWAYNYPHNVIRQGVYIPGCTWDDFCNQLAVPVYPTAVYEAIISLLLFALLWMLAKRLKYAGQLWAVYLFLNGLERFFIEQIRVNISYSFLGIHATQGEIFAVIFMLTGCVLFFLLPALKNRYLYTDSDVKL